MPPSPRVVSISAKSRATSVSGFCRPVATLASLIAAPSGSRMRDSSILAIGSEVKSPEVKLALLEVQPHADAEHPTDEVIDCRTPERRSAAIGEVIDLEVE